MGHDTVYNGCEKYLQSSSAQKYDFSCTGSGLVSTALQQNAKTRGKSTCVLGIAAKMSSRCQQPQCVAGRILLDRQPKHGPTPILFLPERQ